MGCGCKSTKASDVLKKEPISFKSSLNKIISGILLMIFLISFSPIIIIMVWYFILRMVIWNDDNVIGLLVSKFGKNKEINSDDEDINIDEYELMDVDIIK